MCELDYKESWALKNWCFWNYGVGENSWESFRLQGDPTSQSWGKSILNTHWKDWCWSWSSILWPPDVKNWLTRKDPVVGKDWRQEEKGMTEDEMVGWYYQLNEHELEQAPGVGDGQGSLACCSPWDHKESDTTEQLNWTDLSIYLPIYLSIFAYTQPYITYIHSYNGIIFYSSMSACLVVQLCPILWDLLDCSLPGFSVHGIFQARILDCVAISYSRGSSRPSDWTWFSCISCIVRWILYHSDTWDTPVKYKSYIFIQ